VLLGGRRFSIPDRPGHPYHYADARPGRLHRVPVVPV